MSKYNELEASKEKALGFLWQTGNYTYTSSKGISVTLEDTKDVRILEKKKQVKLLYMEQMVHL